MNEDAREKLALHLIQLDAPGVPRSRRRASAHADHLPLNPIDHERMAQPLEVLFMKYFTNLERSFPRIRVLEALQARSGACPQASRRQPEPVSVRIDRLLRAWLREQRGIIVDELATVLHQLATDGFRQVIHYWGQRCGVAVSIRPPDERRLRRWAETQAERLLDQVDRTTRNIVWDYVQENLTAGRSPRAIVESVLEFLADRQATRRRARLIARTESSRSLHFGAHDAMRILGSRAKS